LPPRGAIAPGRRVPAEPGIHERQVDGGRHRPVGDRRGAGDATILSRPATGGATESIMRLGCCASLDNIGDVKAAGCDFIEVGVQPVLQGQLADAEWVKTAPDPAKLPLPIEAANGLVPASLPIVGPERNLHALRQYMERVTRRAKQVGITRLVFGSGGA